MENKFGFKDHRTDRRSFLSTAAKGAVVATLGYAGMNSLSSCNTVKQIIAASSYKTGFDQSPLPYSFNGLENIIDALTMEIHYTKHASAYSKNLKDAAKAEGVDMQKPLEDLLAKISSYSVKMRNNAGGHYNHEMFWKCMHPKMESNTPTGKIKDLIEKNFTSFSNFKSLFSEAAKTRFGSGWAWLYMDASKNLKIGSTANQDNPLMNFADIKGFPLLCLDVWEHAYYLKYQNKRADYIENWWSIINWDYVQQRFDSISM